MYRTQKFPSLFKSAKTVMLYKKGDPNETRSWRPITITSTLYRKLMTHISRSLQLFNESKPFISPEQKGFMRTPAGCAERITMDDEMVHDAARHKKNLYVMTIDF